MNCIIFCIGHNLCKSEGSNRALGLNDKQCESKNHVCMGLPLIAQEICVTISWGGLNSVEDHQARVSGSS